MTLGEKLKTAREENSLSLRDLSKRTRTSISHLSNIERGIRTPSVDCILKLAAALGRDGAAWIAGASQDGDLLVNVATLTPDARKVLSRLVTGQIPVSVLRQLSGEDEPPNDDLRQAA